MSGSWIDVARETMTEDQIHALLVSAEEEVHDDREAALDRAHDDVAGHFEHVVIFAWSDDGDLVTVGEDLDRASEILSHARRFDERLRPLRAHLGTKA